MFCGWQLANDFVELSKLKSGTLEIDVKNGTCEFNGEPNKKLTMPLVLNDWFISDLKENNISIADIEEAHLTVEFDMKNFGSKKGPGPEFLCHSFLVSGSNKFSLNYKGENKGINEVIVT